MGTATVKLIDGKQFIGIDSTQHSVVLSTPDEGIGIKPSDLLLIAVASCSAVDVVGILEKKKMPLTIWKSVPPASRIKIRPGRLERSICATRSAGRT